eukprot:1778638-Rhodomonas_salina.1
MTWRDTLFVWRGDLSLQDNDTRFVWKGTWVGVDSADSRSAPTPSSFSFLRSKMTFDVGGTVTWKGKPQIWSGCELNFEGSYPGWLLDNGEGPELFTDAKHELVFAEGSGSVDEGFPVFAAGWSPVLSSACAVSTDIGHATARNQRFRAIRVDGKVYSPAGSTHCLIARICDAMRGSDMGSCASRMREKMGERSCS